MKGRRITTGIALTTWLAAVTVVFCNACITSVDSGAQSPLALPDQDQFINQGVDAFMEKRCGALDCHGQIGRPLRIYSSNGLRMQDGPNGARDTRDDAARGEARELLLGRRSRARSRSACRASARALTTTSSS